MSLGSVNFAFLRQLLCESTSIQLQDDQRYLVEGRLSGIRIAEGLATLDALVDRLRQPRAQDLCRRIVEALLTNETSFFRDEHPWAALRTKILPELIRARAREGRLSIWCAASSSGQEPYSLAILVREYLAQEARSLRISIHATDISQAMVDRARLGQFNQVEIARGLPVRLRDKYFRRDGIGWEIEASLRQLVTFERLNLAGPWPPSRKIDLVLLRNVLIYFSTPARADILRRLASVISPGGYLMLGSSEVPVLDEALGFEHIMVGRTSLHRKMT
jgi:chemotaxis protein methyltransferase CheR